eukprot:419111_1
MSGNKPRRFGIHTGSNTYITRTYKEYGPTMQFLQRLGYHKYDASKYKLQYSENANYDEQMLNTDFAKLYAPKQKKYSSYDWTQLQLDSDSPVSRYYLSFKHSITPRIAHTLLESGFCILYCMTYDWPVCVEDDFPKGVIPYMSDPKWGCQFIASVHRVLMRLCKGIGFKPNCTAEEMAIYLLFLWAKGVEMLYPEDFEKLPKFSSKITNGHAVGGDEDFFWARQCAVEDEDIYYLFKYDILLQAEYLHPKDWFVPFKTNAKRMNDHLLDVKCEWRKCCNVKSRCTLFVCKGCKSFYYCSRRCQKKHWKYFHSKQCKMLRSNSFGNRYFKFTNH